MRKISALILLLSLTFGFYGCNRITSKEAAQQNKEAEKTAKILESHLKLSDPNFVQHATPEQMKELSENLKRE